MMVNKRIINHPKRYRVFNGGIGEHRLVMERKLGREITRSEVVHHINGDCLDNRPENLMVLLRGQHNAIHGDCKLSEEKVRAIRASDKSNKQLSEIYGVSETTIRHARNKQSWKWVK